MRSAFGVEHGEVSKGLPSYVKHTPAGLLKPGGHAAARREANAQGRFSALMSSKAQSMKSAGNPAWKSRQQIAGHARTAGVNAAHGAKRKVNPFSTTKPKKKVLP